MTGGPKQVNAVCDLGLLGLQRQPGGVHHWRMIGMAMNGGAKGKEFVTLSLKFEMENNQRIRGVPRKEMFQSMIQKYLEMLWKAGFSSMTIAVNDFSDVLEYCYLNHIHLGALGSPVDIVERPIRSDESILQASIKSLKDIYNDRMDFVINQDRIMALVFMNPEPPMKADPPTKKSKVEPDGGGDIRPRQQSSSSSNINTECVKDDDDDSPLAIVKRGIRGSRRRVIQDDVEDFKEASEDGSCVSTDSLADTTDVDESAGAQSPSDIDSTCAINHAANSFDVYDSAVDSIDTYDTICEGTSN